MFLKSDAPYFLFFSNLGYKNVNEEYESNNYYPGQWISSYLIPGEMPKHFPFCITIKLKKKFFQYQVTAQHHNVPITLFLL